jgi:AraC family transcriptional regulator of adaptative response/methylated-DNA-[protein]-cysteine methyltransferase
VTISTEAEVRAAAIVSDPRWASVVARDPRADGKSVYAVKTTGVHCRPSCASRGAQPENVEFFPNAEDAERAGLRAGKRCKPDQLPLVARQVSG